MFRPLEDSPDIDNYIACYVIYVPISDKNNTPHICQMPLQKEIVELCCNLIYLAKTLAIKMAAMQGANIAVKLHPYKVCSTKIHKESNSACTMRVVEKKECDILPNCGRKEM